MLMDLIRNFFKAIGKYFNKETTPKKIKEAKENGGTVETNKVGKEEAYVFRIFSSKQVREENGYYPEYYAAETLSRSLTQHNIAYEIEWGFDTPLNPPTEDPYKNDFEAIGWLTDQNLPESSDVNLLLTHDSGGVTLGGHSIAGARGLEEGVGTPRSGNGPAVTRLYVVLHEVGHALGVAGDFDPDTDPVETAGTSWSSGNKWHKTPMISTANASENVCGESIAQRNNKEVVLHNEYGTCAVENFNDPKNSSK